MERIIISPIKKGDSCILIIMREVRIKNVQALIHDITTLPLDTAPSNFPSQRVHTTTKVIFSIVRLYLRGVESMTHGDE